MYDKKHLRIFCIAVSITILVFLFTFYYIFHNNGIEGNEGVKYLIGMSQANLSEPWRIVMTDEIRKEAAKYDEIKVIYRDAAQSVSKQKKDIEELVNLGIDLLIVSVNDSKELTPIISEIYKTTPVIVLDRAVEGYDYTLFIGPDNESIGKHAGELVLEFLGDKGGNVVEIQGLCNSPPVVGRSKGFKEVIGKHNNVKIIKTIATNWQRDEAEDKLGELLKQRKDIDTVFAYSDYMALGAYKAAAKENMSSIKIIGVDGLYGTNGGMQLVEKKILHGTFTCPTGGKEAVQYAINILQNKKMIPKKLILRSNKITKSNVKQHLREEQHNLANDTYDNKKIILGYSQVGSESAWRTANSKSIMDAAKKEDIDLRFLDANQKQQNQIDAINEFIEEGVDVIAFSPVIESGWDEVLMKAKKAGIPVILSDRTVDADNSLWTCFMGSDFEEEGRRAAKWMIDYLNTDEEIKIVELEGTLGCGPAIDRKKGFREFIKKYPNYKIIKSKCANFFAEEGQKAVEEFLKEEGSNIDVIYSHNDDMAIGAVKAVEDYGLLPGKDIVIISIDGTKQALQLIKKGKMNCTIECNPFLGSQLMEAVKDIKSGKQLPLKIITMEAVFDKEITMDEILKRKY